MWCRGTHLLDPRIPRLFRRPHLHGAHHTAGGDDGGGEVGFHYGVEGSDPLDACWLVRWSGAQMVGGVCCVTWRGLCREWVVGVGDMMCGGLGR